MSAESDLYSALSGASGVTDLVSTRIYPSFVPLGTDYPAIGYALISGAKIGSNDCKRSRLQIDLYDQSYSGVKALRDAVITAIDAASDWAWNEGPDIYEEDTGVHHQSVDVFISH